MDKLSYLHRPATYHLDFRTIPEKLRHQAEVHGDKEVYVFHEPNRARTSATAGELHEKSKQLAHAFVQLGIEKGDIVALCLQNDYHGLLCLLSVIYAGGIVLNVFSAKEDGSDMKAVLKKAGAKAFIIYPGESNSVLKACMNVIDEVDEKGHVKCIDVPTLKYFITSKNINGDGTLTLQDLLDQDVDAELPRLDPDDISHMFTTSGSTGEPKFAPMSHLKTTHIGYQLHDSMKYQPDDVIYTERRFAWIGGFPFMLLHDGVKVVTKTRPISSTEEHCRFTLDVITSEKCNVACLFPATIVGLTDLISGRDGPPLLKSIHTGALPVASVTYNGIGKIAGRITNCYGSSEAGAIASFHVTELGGNLDYNTGSPSPGVEVKVVDSDGYVVARYDRGAIYVRSPTLLNEYYGDKAKTSEVMTLSRWFNTDDTGYVDADGNLIVEGRQSDIILQGGKVEIATQIEKFIKTHPDVADAVVVPVPDKVYFQLACACIIAKPGTNLLEHDVRDFYKTKYSISTTEGFGTLGPRMVLFMQEYPRLYTGKPDKKQLIAHAISMKSNIDS